MYVSNSSCHVKYICIYIVNFGDVIKNWEIILSIPHHTGTEFTRIGYDLTCVKQQQIHNKYNPMTPFNSVCAGMVKQNM